MSVDKEPVEAWAIKAPVGDIPIWLETVSHFRDEAWRKFEERHVYLAKQAETNGYRLVKVRIEEIEE